MAFNIINFFYEHEYTYLPVLPEGETTEKLVETTPPVAKLGVYPNPSRTWADVVYELPADTKEGTLLVTSVNGQVIQQINLTQTNGTIEFNTQDWMPGVYFIALMQDYQLEHRTTLIIRR